MNERLAHPIIPDENPYLRADEYPAAVSQAGCGIVCGHRGHLFAVSILVPDHTRLPAVSAYVEANRPSILFELGIACLRSGLGAIQAQAKSYVRNLRRDLNLG